LQAGVLDGGNDEPLIAADRLTVAGLLKAQGYTTACIGKWHLGFQSKTPAAKSAKKKGMGNAGLPVGAEIIDGPVTRGFDLFWGCSNARTMSALIEGDRVIETIEPIAMLPRLGKRAVSYVQERSADAKAGKPFFLYLPLTSPHTPILPTPEWQGKSGLGDYGDFVMMTDAIVGDVLAALDQAGLADNTLVIFTADNGCSPQAGTDKLEKQGHFASERLRGYKADIWDGGHRVPFFVRWPGKVKAGSQSDQLICHTDFMATCAEILGVKLPDTAAEDSMSLLPALLGTENAVSRQSVIHHSINGRFAVREVRWKLCLCPGSGGWGKPGDVEAAKQGLPAVQLYDLSTEIAETKNLSAEHPDIVAKLTKQLEASIANGRSTPGVKQANDVEVRIFKTKAAQK
jgi:arylsulfatase A-like enzyme